MTIQTDNFYLTILMNTQERRCLQLFNAARFGYVGVVKTLIDNKYIDVNSRNDVSNYMCMHTIIMMMHCCIALVLLQYYVC